MRTDFEYLGETSKKWLATIASHPLYRLRRLEALLYASLLLNLALLTVLVFVI